MWPSVTQVLSPFSGIEELKRRSPHVIEAAAARGTAVHRYCEAIAQGFFAVGVPLEHTGYVDSFMRWFENVDEVVATELRLLDETIGFHGQFDILCRMRGDTDLSIWDYKTSETTGRTWPAQNAAYRHLARVKGYPTIRGGMIRLRKTGKPAIVDEYTATARHDWNVFVSAFNVHNNLLRKRYEQRNASICQS